MIKFCGKTAHNLKIKNKPVKQGFKIWILGDHGYVWTWLWYSLEVSTEGITKRDIKYTLNALEDATIGGTVVLASTHALVVKLAKELTDFYAISFICVLNNLFLNINVARCLFYFKIACYGTVRQNA